MTITIESSIGTTHVVSLVGVGMVSGNSIIVGSHGDAPSTIWVMVNGERSRLLVAEIGWSREDAANARAQLLGFEEGWDAPEMSAYDAL